MAAEPSLLAARTLGRLMDDVEIWFIPAFVPGTVLLYITD